MKRIGILLLLLLTVGATVVGCGSGQEGKENPKEHKEENTKVVQPADITVPETIDLAVREVYDIGEIGERYCDLGRPVYSIGVEEPEQSDQEMVAAGQYAELKNALSVINEDNRRHAEHAAHSEVPLKGERIFCETEGFVTRADTQVVSFYERTKRYEDAEWEKIRTGIRTHNIETSTGRTLEFSDVFRDTKKLPSQIAEAMKKAYPKERFAEDIEERIGQSIESGDGNVAFALGYGGVHIFAGNILTSDEQNIYQVTLSYELLTSVIDAVYTTAPKEYILKLDYEMNYFPPDMAEGFSMAWSMKDDFEGKWTLRVEGEHPKTHEELYINHAPMCWLLRSGEKNYVYLTVPAGDISIMTDIYELTKEGIDSLGQVEVAIRSDTILNPHRVQMSHNNIIYVDQIMMIAHGNYQVGATGMPEPIEKMYELEGRELILKQSCRVQAPDPKDAAASGGMWNLPAGIKLRPYRTDMESWIDFITEEDQICRFSIDEFSYEMQLDNFGGLEDLFEVR